MDKDKVIELAKRASHPSVHNQFLEYSVELIRLAQLVRDDYCAELLSSRQQHIDNLCVAVDSLLRCPSGVYCDSYSSTQKLAQSALNAAYQSKGH